LTAGKCSRSRPEQHQGLARGYWLPEFLSCGSGRFLVETLGQQLNRFPKEYSRFGFRRSCSQARLRAHESEYFGGTLVYMLGVNLRYENVRAIFSISRAQQCANLGMAGTACAIFL
jgi:hypothetical protein